MYRLEHVMAPLIFCSLDDSGDRRSPRAQVGLGAICSVPRIRKLGESPCAPSVV
jgi:hypothetical protein